MTQDIVSRGTEDTPDSGGCQMYSGVWSLPKHWPFYYFISVAYQYFTVTGREFLEGTTGLKALWHAGFGSSQTVGDAAGVNGA